ncbi:YneF family protein (plasmid) [Paucilactobacillus suebicus]|uniref:YneF family protein n=1 Tax=Paucilactobacillus suebicus TaxID=152335 RepID=UPI0033650B23
MATGVWILIVVIALLIGAVAGFFIARKYMENYLKNNPPINEDMLRTMMLQMGQKPSAKKLHQMMQAMQDAIRW